MTAAEFLAEVWILAPVAILFVLGFAITLRSGGRESARVIGTLANFAKTLVLLSLVAGLMIVAQAFAGYKMGLAW